MGTFMDLLWSGGILMIPLFVCSVLSLAIIIERIFVLREKEIVKNRISMVSKSLYCIFTKMPIRNPYKYVFDFGESRIFEFFKQLKAKKGSGSPD